MSLYDASYHPLLSSCWLCPRECHVNRYQQAGFCGASANLKIARAALHFWEEPCISGTNGSGTVFFSGCSLKCIFCQNYTISTEAFGQEISTGRLTEIFLELQQQGAHNINLVTAASYVPQILEALQQISDTKKLSIPIAYNSGGYESIETLKLLEGTVSIYMPDFKFWDSELSKAYTGVADYQETAIACIQEMYRQVGSPVIENGILKRGVLLRHLVLPSHRKDSEHILEWISQTFGNNVLLSLMSQYTPTPYVREHKTLSRKITSFEYDRVLEYANRLGLQGYMQERTSAQSSYTPPFDLEGVSSKQT